MVKPGKTRWLAGGLVLLAVSSGGVAVAQPASYKIIVNATNPVKEATRKVVADLFLKKFTHWPGGLEALPVDLSSRSPVRVQFSKDVLVDSVAGTLNYWQQQIFSGRGLPPPVKAENDVIAFVQANPGAVAYVAEDTPLPEGTKVLLIKK
jgi:ABC-type phosphate transport system substrate-binding protein